MRLTYLIFVLLMSKLIFVIPASQAAVVEVEGQASLHVGVAQARSDALEDAMRQASLRAKAHVSSTQLMNKGQVSEDQISLTTDAKVSDVEVLWEGSEQGVYKVAIRARVDAESMCHSSQGYRKAVAVTGFALVDREQASVGQLQNIESAMPRVLINQLNSMGQLHALDASRISLYQQPSRAPSAQNQQSHLTTSVALATELGAQYVVSGVIRGLGQSSGMSQSGNQSYSENDSWLKLAGFASGATTRQFAFDVFVHDGMSGALIFSRSYATQGEWDVDQFAQVKFASPQFWQSDYGEEVRTLLLGAVDDVSNNLRCQPFMAKIIKSTGYQIHLEALAGAGIRPGDKFSVYRTSTFYNLDLESRVELIPTKLTAVVKRVQPQFVVAELEKTSQQFAIQRDDVVVAW